MKQTFKVKEAPEAKRTSPRNYTHAVIGQFDYDAQLIRVDKILDLDKKNFEYDLKISSMVAGQKELVTGCVTPWYMTIDQDMINRAQKHIINSGCTTSDQYAEKLRQDRVARCIADKKANDGKWAVLQWSQSFYNASKAIGTFTNQGYKLVKVVETSIELKK